MEFLTTEKLIDAALVLGKVAAMLIIGIIIIKLILRFERKILEKSTLDESVYLFILRATKIVLWVVLIVAVLPVFGIPATSLWCSMTRPRAAAGKRPSISM